MRSSRWGALPVGTEIPEQIDEHYYTWPRPPSLQPLSFLMDTRDYPGQDLSLSQLIFALNEEVKRVAFSPSYVWYDHPTGTALITSSK